ncbi:MAG: hypothetical protein CSA62_12105 [Planctomycetota bacterium]|nr:MAG: hypothetical protein CSA62_12105 [Planctomycetota bacterium]
MRFLGSLNSAALVSNNMGDTRTLLGLGAELPSQKLCKAEADQLLLWVAPSLHLRAISQAQVLWLRLDA